MAEESIDLSEVKQLFSQLANNLTDNAIASQLVKAEIGRIMSAIKQGQDAYGKPFKPVADNPTPLIRSRKLLNSFVGSGNMANGFTISNTTSYADRQNKKRVFLDAQVSARRIAEDYQAQLLP